MALPYQKKTLSPHGVAIYGEELRKKVINLIAQGKSQQEVELICQCVCVKTGELRLKNGRLIPSRTKPKKEAMESPIQSIRKILQFKDNERLLESVICFVEASFASLQNQARHFLHGEELSVLEAFPSEKRKRSYLLGRYAAKHALVLKDRAISVTDIFIKSGAFEQPVVYSASKQKHQVSISHCEQGAVALVFPETHPMGIDLEEISSKNAMIVEPELTFQEKRLLEIESCSSQEKGFLLLWTLKEALSKALRTGLTSSSEIYEVSNIQYKRGYWVSTFQNFTQYQGYSFLVDNLMCSLVYPQNISLITNCLSPNIIADRTLINKDVTCQKVSID